MSGTTYGHSQAYILLGVLLSYAPNASAQADVTALYNDMQAKGLSEAEMVGYLCDYIKDTVAGTLTWG